MSEANVTHRWEISVNVQGIAKRERKVKHHRAVIATAHDDGTDESKPLIGGHDIQTLAKTWIAANIKTVQKASIKAIPIEIKDCGDGCVMQSFLMFNPRMFGCEVVL